LDNGCIATHRARARSIVGARRAMGRRGIDCYTVLEHPLGGPWVFWCECESCQQLREDAAVSHAERQIEDAYYFGARPAQGAAR
jgi:hypothetical protein